MLCGTNEDSQYPFDFAFDFPDPLPTPRALVPGFSKPPF